MGEAAKKLLSKWQDRVTVARKWRDAIAEEKKWQVYIDEYEGKYDVVLGNVPVPPINEVFAYTQSSISNLYARNPYLTVNAEHGGTILGAYILEAAINHEWRRLRIKDQVELEIMDCIHVGHGWNKSGLNVKTSGSGDQLRLESETLFANRVSWKDMVFNIGSKNPPHDCLWMGHRIYRPTDDLKNDYGGRAKNLKGSPFPSVDDSIRKNMIYKDDINFSSLWEVHDAREKQILLFSDESMTDLMEDPRPMPDYMVEFPFEMLSFNDIPDIPYPMSDIAPWNAQILEKIKVFTQMLNQVKRANRQMLMLKGAMAGKEKDKFEKGIDGSVLDVTKDPNTMTKIVDFGQVNPDMYLALDRIDALIRKTNGQPEFAQGGSTKTGTRTLGELKAIAGGADARTNRKQDRIERHSENIARHLLAHITHNMDIERIAKVTGKEPPEIIQAFQMMGKYDPSSQTIKFKKEDIIGEYGVSVKAGSTLPLDKEGRDAILGEVFRDSIPLAAAPSVPPFMAEVIKERLKGYDIQGLIQAFDQQQTAAAQKDQQNAQVQDTDMQKTTAETAKRDAQAKQIQVDTLIKGAQAVGRATGLIHPEVSLQK